MICEREERMIQDIFPDALNNHFEPYFPAPDSKAVCFRAGKLLSRYDAQEKTLLFPLWRELPPDTPGVYLFSIGQDRFFLALGEADALPGCIGRSMQEIRMLPRTSNTPVFAAYTAYHLWQWYESSKFCGACGARTVFDSRERAKACPACGAKIYPRINPAVIVGVTNGDRLLLTRYKTGYAHNALVAGFTEIGETVEETVRREVMEEVGLRVKNVRYYRSQPWGVASDILMGFFCQVDGDDTIRRDDGELKYAAWVPRQEIVLLPTDDSLTNEMMKLFKENKGPR